MTQSVVARRSLTTGLCLLAGLTMLSYAVASSAAQSLYLSAFGAEQLPWVWLGVALASVVATTWLNQLAERLDIVSLFGVACRASGLSLLLILALLQASPKYGAFLLYIWKDIYIIVLVELFWTFANVVFGVRSATSTYGLFCAAGSLGSVLGNVVLSQSAHSFGTKNSLWTLLPLLWIISWGCRRLAHNVPVPDPRVRAEVSAGAGFRHSLQILRNSKILLWLLLLVAVVQAYLTLLDFRFSHAIEMASSNEAERTAIIGNMYAIINAVSFALQMGTGIILKAVGLSKTMLALPFFSAGMLAWMTGQPMSLFAVCAAQLTGKSLDYSLFRAAKEVLYIPMSYGEKTQGKAIIDILTYRVAKGLVSMVLLTLASLGLAHQSAGWLMSGLLALWLLSAAMLLRLFRARM